VLVASLAEAVKGAVVAGDLAAARVAVEAMGKLLAIGGREGEVDVVDLAAERERRGG
jgi:hypothetical protein